MPKANHGRAKSCRRQIIDTNDLMLAHHEPRHSPHELKAWAFMNCDFRRINEGKHYFTKNTKMTVTYTRKGGQGNEKKHQRNR